MYTASKKQKLNTKCSMEAELVLIADSKAQVLQTRHFLSSQGGIGTLHNKLPG